MEGYSRQFGCEYFTDQTVPDQTTLRGRSTVNYIVGVMRADHVVWAAVRNVEMECARPMFEKNLVLGMFWIIFKSGEEDQEPGCNKVAPVKPEAGSIFLYSYSNDKCISKLCTVTVTNINIGMLKDSLISEAG